MARFFCMCLALPKNKLSILRGVERLLGKSLYLSRFGPLCGHRPIVGLIKGEYKYSFIRINILLEKERTQRSK